MSAPRIGALFAGYGGLDLAVTQVYGGDMAWYSEIDKGALKVLAHRFPDVPNVGSVTEADWSSVEPVDILTGGSPCQDLSHAGRRAGMTEGTRSNLWVAMREAIAQLRPAVVVWENVRGAYSAEADSALEFCAGCMGDAWYRGAALRALGRVLGDLSELGYDARWHGLRAADVGAPHGRFRVFVVASDARGEAGNLRPGLRADQPARDGGRLAARVGGSALFPTPRATDGTKGGPGQRGSSGDLMLPSAVALLPTPAVNDMGEGKTPDAWDEWTAKMKAAHGNGNGHGASLAIEAQRLLPTPTSQAAKHACGDTDRGAGSPDDANLWMVVGRLVQEETNVIPAQDGPREELRDVRSPPDPQEVHQRTPRGPNRVPQAEVLLAELRQHQADRDEGRPALAGQEAQGFDLSGLRSDDGAARSPRGPEPSEQRPVEPDDAVRVVPPHAALAGGPACAHGCGPACGGHSAVAWGAYEAAIRRWEVRLGRPAPDPTQLSAKGNPQLSARFCEWLMGLPAGWVTDVPGLTRNEALKALGNGVVPAQAAEALRVMASWAVAA